MTAPVTTRLRPGRVAPQGARKQRIVVRRHVDLNRDQARGVRVGLRWPVGLDEAIRAELTGHLPLPVAKLVEQAETRGYMAGRLETLQRVARNVAELDLLGEGWRETAMAVLEQTRRQQREARELRVAERRAAANIAAGRHPDWQYTGRSRGGSGRVCWETGYPVETANQWLSRPRWMPMPTTTARWIPAPITGPLANVTEMRPTRPTVPAREAA